MSAPSYRPFACLGIDVSKHHLDLAIVQDDQLLATRRLTNTPAGCQAILRWLQDNSIDLIVLEGTGGYERAAAQRLDQAGWSVAIVNPRQVRDYAGALGYMAKTDEIDAKVIARFGAERKPRPTSFPGPSQRQFELLVARRRQLVGLRSRELCRLEQADDEIVRQSIKTVIQAFDDQIEQLETLLDEMIRESERLQRLDRILQDVKGVGPVTSRTLLSELPELGQCSRQEVAALVGVAPYNCDSGQRRGQRAIRGGRSTVRSALYMAAVSAIRTNPVIRPYYEQLRSRGKCFKVAIVACMRKLLIHLNTLVRDALQSCPAT